MAGSRLALNPFAGASSAIRVAADLPTMAADKF